MPTTDAKPVPQKNVAFCFYFALRNVTTNQLITSWTGMDSEVSLDRGAFTDCTNEAVEIGTSGCGYIDFTAAEMNADSVVYKLTVTNANASPLVITFYPEEAGDYRAAVTSIGDNVITAVSIASSALDNKGNWNVGKTGYALSASGLAAITNWTVAITGNITGNITGSVNAVTTAIVLPTIPTNWITAAGITASALDNKGNWNVGKTDYALSTSSIAAIDAALLNAGDATDLIASIVTRIGNTNVDQAAFVAAVKAALFDTGSSANKLNVDVNGKVAIQPTTGLGNQTTNITGTISGVTNAVVLPTIPTNWITAAGIDASALNNKGNWNVGKTGYELTQLFPANFAILSIAGSGFISASVESISNDTINSNSLNVSAVNEIRDSILDVVIENGLTLRECIRLANAVLFGASTGMNTAPVFKSLDGSKNRVVGTISGETRTISSRDGT